MVQPLHSCVRDTRSLRFSILRETDSAGRRARAGRRRRLQAAPRVGDGVVRHALTFTVKPGSESKVVAKILAGYTSPEAQVDDTTRLRRTSLFMHGNRVVRAVEVQGDLLAALRHVARQPEVRAVEEAINPYLEQDRTSATPNSAPGLLHPGRAARGAPRGGGRERPGRRHPAARAVLPGQGGLRHGAGPVARPARTRLAADDPAQPLARQHRLPARRRRRPAHRSRGPDRERSRAVARRARSPQDGRAAASARHRRGRRSVQRPEIAHFLERADMALVTDRRAPGA